MLSSLLHSAAVRGALSGLVSAAVVDVHAFLTWKSVADVKTYQWGTAALRWGQGVISGAIVGAGYGALLS